MIRRRRHSLHGPLWLALLVLLTTAPARGDDTLALQKGEHYRSLAPHLTYLRDERGALTLSEALADPDRFEPIPGQRVDFGFSDATFWLRLPVANATAAELDLRLALNMRFMQEFDAWLIDDDGPSLLVRDHADVPFQDRPIPYRHLAAPFSLAPGERATIVIRYWSEGTTALPLSIETDLSFTELAAFHNTKNAAFYGFVAFMFAYSLMFMVMMRERLFFFYALYLLTVTFYVFHMDGLSFQFLWPERPGWNSFAALPLGLSLTVGAALFSREFLKTRDNHPFMDRLLLGVIGLTVVMMMGPLVLDIALVKQIAFPYTFLATLLFLGCGIVALRRQRVGNRFYVAGWTGLAVAALISTFAHWSPGMMAVGMSFETMRIGILLDATMMALAVIDQIRGLRRERDNALAHESVVMQEMLELHDRFLTLENRYAMARNLAEARGLQLATTGHDLRQPLASLRAAMQNLKSGRGGADAPTTNHLRGTLAYLEKLVEGVMDSATHGAPEQASGGTEDGSAEVFPAQLVLDNVQRMFQQDASAQGLEIRSVPTRLALHADPLVVMRIMANFASNAVKYASGGRRMLIGCRRQGDGVTLLVADDGPGIPEEELPTLTRNYVRGSRAPETANGHGLGLGIVADLARRHGYRFDLRSREGHGTTAAITVPRG